MFFVVKKSIGSLHPASQHLGNAPRLSYTSARQEWRLGIKDLADRPDARFIEVRQKSFEKTARSHAIIRIDFQPCINKWGNEPAPDCALMICRVARSKITVISRLVIRMVWSKR